MDAHPLPNSFDTARAADGRRVCPGCGGTVDLARYGCVGGSLRVTCSSCGGAFRFDEYRVR